MNPVAFLSIRLPFGPFVPLDFSAVLLDCSIGLPAVAYCLGLIHESRVGG